MLVDADALMPDWADVNEVTMFTPEYKTKQYGILCNTLHVQSCTILLSSLHCSVLVSRTIIHL